jgi:hypothetical protein
MLLSLLGLKTTRKESLTIFGLKRTNPNYEGARHVEIGAAFAKAVRVSRWRWENHRRFNFISICGSLQDHLQATGQPTLFSFGAVHRNGEWRCIHVAVATGVADGMIELLDPLGGRPPIYKRSNVLLREKGSSKQIEVVGSLYSVDPESRVAVLRWV